MKSIFCCQWFYEYFIPEMFRLYELKAPLSQSIFNFANFLAKVSKILFKKPERIWNQIVEHLSQKY